MTTTDNLTPTLVSYSYRNNPINFNIGSTVMINATNMAKSFGKRPVDWLRFNQSQEFISTLSKVRNHTLADLLQVRKGGANPGTWMHEDVALEFARWLSPEFAIWCNDRVKEILLNQRPQTNKNELYRLIDKNNELFRLMMDFHKKYEEFSNLYMAEREKNMELKHKIRELYQLSCE